MHALNFSGMQYRGDGSENIEHSGDSTRRPDFQCRQACMCSHCCPKTSTLPVHRGRIYEGLHWVAKLLMSAARLEAVAGLKWEAACSSP